MDILTKVFVGLVVSVIVLELLGGLRSFTSWLVRLSASRLPAERRDRFIEEQYAEIEDIQGPVSKFVNALGAFWAARALEQSYVAEQRRDHLVLHKDDGFSNENTAIDTFLQEKINERLREIENYRMEAVLSIIAVFRHTDFHGKATSEALNKAFAESEKQKDDVSE